MKFTSIICALFLLLIPSVTFAQSEKSFQVQLFYDSTEGQLRLDDFVDTPTKTVGQQFNEDYTLYLSREGLQNAGLSRNEVYSIEFKGFASNSQWTIFLSGRPIQGEQTIYLPYYPHAKSFTIQDPRGSSVTIETKQLAQCNQNNVCEYEEGETRGTCPADCDAQIRTEPVDFSSETEQELQSQNGVVRDEEGTVLLKDNSSGGDNTDSQSSSNNSSEESPNIWFLIGGIGLFAVAVGSWIYIRFIREEE